MRHAVALALILASSAHADPTPVELRSELIAAFRKGDVEGVKQRVQLPLEMSHLRFIDPACSKFMGRRVVVEEAELPAFVRCVARADVKAPPTGERADAVYGPGSPLSMPIRDGKVARLSSVRVMGDRFAIAEAVFVSHIRAFSREVIPAPALKKTLDASSDERVRGSVVMCVNEQGKIDAVHVDVEGDASYGDTIRNVARTWSVTPFRFGKKAVAACSLFVVGYPAKRLTLEPFPVLPPVPSSPPSSSSPPAP